MSGVSTNTFSLTSETESGIKILTEKHPVKEIKETDMHNRGRTYNTTCSSVIHTKVFGIGFKEGLQDKPLRYRPEWCTNEMWNYERGRQFAYYCKSIGRPDMKLKMNRKVTWEATDHLSDAIRSRFII